MIEPDYDMVDFMNAMYKEGVEGFTPFGIDKDNIDWIVVIAYLIWKIYRK